MANVFKNCNMLVYKLTKYITVDKAVIKRLSIISSQQKQKKKKNLFLSLHNGSWIYVKISFWWAHPNIKIPNSQSEHRKRRGCDIFKRHRFRDRIQFLYNVKDIRVLLFERKAHTHHVLELKLFSCFTEVKAQKRRFVPSFDA